MTNEQSVIYVLAGTHQQAVNAVRSLRPGQRWRYVSEARNLYGIRDGTYVVTGTFWERRDASEIYDLARAAGLEPTDD